MAEPTPTQTGRRAAYGLNVAIAIVAAVVIVVLLNWGANLTLDRVSQRAPHVADWVRYDATQNRDYSLSPQTVAVLSDLPDNFRIITLLRTADARTTRARDLVDEYAGRSPKIAVEHYDPTYDVARLDAFYAQLQERYADRLEPMRKAIDAGRAALDTVKRHSIEQGQLLKKLRADPALTPKLGDFVDSVDAVISRLPRSIDDVDAELTRYLEGGGRLPNYTAARDDVRRLLGELDSRNYAPVVDRFERAAAASDTPASVKESLLALVEKIKATRREVQAARPALDAAQPIPEYDRLSSDLTGAKQVVVVIGPRDVRVVPLDDMYRQPSLQQQMQAGDEAPAPIFLGEERITGALVGMTMKTRPLVVFVYSGRQPALGPGGLYAAWGERLSKLNFDVQQWSPMGRPGPMGQPMPAGPPPQPAQGQKAVWILLPADADPRMMMMGGGSQPLVDAVRERLAAGDSAMVILGFNPAAGMMGTDPVVQLLDTWGVKTQLNQIVLREVPVPRREPVPDNNHEITEWPTEHPIARPLVGMSGIVQQGIPLELADTKDRGVTLAPILEVRGQGLWAEKNFEEGKLPKRDPATARNAYVIGAAAQGKDNRLVVLGDATWASDIVLTLGYGGRGTAEQTGAIFPANAELAVNSVYWLAGLDQLIAASPRTQDIPRVREIPPAKLSALRWSLSAGLPLLAFAVGLGVWFVRRRG